MSLRFPIVIWTGAPEHIIVTIEKSQDEKMIITGGLKGEACKWIESSTNSSNSLLKPQFLMIPSSCSSLLSLCICESHKKELLTASF